MKIIYTCLFAASLLVSASISHAEDKIRTEGAAPGEWTMDFDAAKKVAAEKKLPILLDFSGSDWCGWCKLMEDQVFTQDAWKAYATNHIMMVLLDFPRDKSKVPEKYVKRNEELQQQYGIRGFPTFIVLDDDAKTVMGQLSAGRDKNPQSFIAELKKLFRYRDSEVENYSKTLKNEDAESYKKIVAELNTLKKKVAEQQQTIAEAKKEIAEAQEKMEATKKRATEFRASKAGDENLKRYREISAQLKQAEKELQDWMNTDPVQNEANGQKFISMSRKIEDLKTQLSEF